MSDDSSAGSHRRPGAPATARRLHARWTSLVAPRPSGLPNLVVLTWFPIVVLLVVVALVALDLNGSSTGVYWTTLHRGPDPDLLLGRPRPIRSDEWLVQSSWVVSQVSQGYPTVNHVFPGGMDATVMNDLPAHHWSALFRPHTWGFLLLGLDHGMAWRWWVPAALTVVSAYTFVVSVLPRRPALGAGLAVLVMLQPVVQWWWLPIVPNPMAFAFAGMSAVVWGLRARRWWVRAIPAAAAGFLAVDMAMSIYVPFMVPAALVLAAFTLGYVAQFSRTAGVSARLVVRSLVPVLIAAVVALCVVGAWVLTRRSTVDSLLGTVYPGRRVFPPGSGGHDDLVGLLSAPFQRSLQLDLTTGLGPNQSEASSALLVSLFLTLPVVALLIALWRGARSTDWLLVALLGAQTLVVVWLYVPGWDTVAALLGLDRSAPQRMRLFFVISAVVLVVALIDHLDRRATRVAWLPTCLGGLSVLVASAWVWRDLAAAHSPVVPSVSAVVVTALLAVGVMAVARRHAGAGIGLVLVGALTVGAGVNPLYRGVFDLRVQTKAGRAVAQVEGKDPGSSWVGVGGNFSSAVLVESGVRAWNGVQTYPSAAMWRQLDPSGQHEQEWNRLANVTWRGAGGEPLSGPDVNPVADQIVLSFDSCSTFAQGNVDFVLAEGVPIQQPCVDPVKRMQENGFKQWIYRVVPPPGE